MVVDGYVAIFGVRVGGMVRLWGAGGRGMMWANSGVVFVVMVLVSVGL